MSAVAGQRERHRGGARRGDRERHAGDDVVHHISGLADVDTVQLKYGVRALAGVRQEIGIGARGVIEQLQVCPTGGVGCNRKIIAYGSGENRSRHISAE